MRLPSTWGSVKGTSAATMFKGVGVAALTICCSAFTGCHHADTPPPKPPPMPADLQEGMKAPPGAPHLHRFQTGDTWTYSIHSPDGDTTATLTVLPEKVKAPDGKDCFIVRTETVQNGNPISIERAYRQDEAGSEILCAVPGENGARFKWGAAPQPTSIRMKSPIYPGEVWHNALHLTDGSVQSVHASVFKEDPVTVPAGTFAHALLLNENITLMKSLLDDHPKARFVKVWIDPAIGFPLKQYETVPKGSEVQELVNYHVGADPAGQKQ